MLCTLYSCIWFTHLFLIIIKNCQSGWNKSTAKVLHCLRSLVIAILSCNQHLTLLFILHGQIYHFQNVTGKL